MPQKYSKNTLFPQHFLSYFKMKKKKKLEKGKLGLMEIQRLFDKNGA